MELRPIRLADVEAVLRWSRDAEFCAANDWPLQRDEAQIRAWWAACVARTDIVRLAIIVDGQCVGYSDIANRNGQTTELGIAIGERSMWGKGLGAHAMQQTITYATTHLGITVYQAETHATNTRAIHMLTRLGFHEAGRAGTELYLGTPTRLIQYTLHSQN